MHTYNLGDFLQGVKKIRVTLFVDGPQVQGQVHVQD